MQSEWYKCWFDSPYYHLLYSHRDENEAEFFLSGLVDHLSIPEGSSILDLCCGKGRHAVFLRDKGFRVTGLDLSPNSIREASRAGCERLEFLQGDMREAIPGKKFDYIFNLFTSFGYFEEENENLRVLNAVHSMLRENGIFVIDFLNATKLMNEISTEETKKTGDILFRIKRKTEKGFVEKTIDFEDKGTRYTFTEKVKLLDYSALKNMLNATGLQIISTFGSYSLSRFDEKTSDRLIIIAQKI